MIVLLVILSLGLLGIIIYFSISPKSSGSLKLTALIALILIALSLLVCGFLIIRGLGEDPDAVNLPAFMDTQQSKKNSNILDIFFLLLLLAVVSLVIAKSIKEQKKLAAAVKKAAPASQFFHGSDDLDSDLKPANEEEVEEEESFDLSTE